jgi:hypothetical protein
MASAAIHSIVIQHYETQPQGTKQAGVVALIERLAPLVRTETSLWRTSKITR